MMFSLPDSMQIDYNVYLRMMLDMKIGWKLCWRGMLDVETV